jgi:hypothetical protein
VRALRVQHLCAHRQTAGLSAVQAVDFHVSQGSEEAANAALALFAESQRTARGASRPTHSTDHFSTTDSRADAFLLAISRCRL